MNYLKKRFSDPEATLVIEYFEAKAESKYEEKRDVLATKEDIHSVKQEISASELRINRNIFVTNIVQFLATVGSLLAIVKFFIK